jgi:hypothetical protein
MSSRVENGFSSELGDYLATGAEVLSVIAWEMARLVVGPVAEAHHAGRLAYLDDFEINLLKAGASAQAAVVAAAQVSGDAAARLLRRAEIAAPLLLTYGVLLRDRLHPDAYPTAELQAIVGEVLLPVNATISSEAGSAAHAQRLLDRSMADLVARAGSLARRLQELDPSSLGPHDIPSTLPDFMQLGQALMDQTELRARWITPWVLPLEKERPPMGEGGPRGLTAAEARATLELERSSALRGSADALTRVVRVLMTDALGSEIAGYAGPRIRWLHVCSAVETLAAEEPHASGDIGRDPATAPTRADVTARTKAIPSATTEPIGERVGQYRLEGEIGRGGMGVVHRAWDTRLDRPVALKVLSPSAVGLQEARARFTREMALAARVEHPSIVPVYAADLLPVPFIAMRLIDGPNLKDRVDGAPLEHSLARRLFSDVASALGALHQQGIVHRDLKPQNVLVEHAGVPGERSLLTDFGIARRDGDTAVTRDGLVIGTPRYTAPEVAHGFEATDRSDQYSLACLLRFMLIGADHCDHRDAAVPEWAVDPLQRALARDPADRFESVAAFAAAVDQRQ